MYAETLVVNFWNTLEIIIIIYIIKLHFDVTKKAS